MPYSYILFSESLDRFYTGSTSLAIEERLNYHHSKHKGFTSKAKDWIIVFSKNFETIQEARSLETKIKKRGAKRFLAGHDM